jgi:hypothetical protein
MYNTYSKRVQAYSDSEQIYKKSDKNRSSTVAGPYPLSEKKAHKGAHRANGKIQQ